MSRVSKVSEAVSKLIEIESIMAAPAFGKTDFGLSRIKVLLEELNDLRFINALTGETAINDWHLKIIRKMAEFFNNKEINNG